MIPPFDFLSCLFGSSRLAPSVRSQSLFLSCLFGSSLDAFLAKSLLGQPFPGEALSLPSFLPFL